MAASQLLLEKLLLEGQSQKTAAAAVAEFVVAVVAEFADYLQSDKLFAAAVEIAEEVVVAVEVVVDEAAADVVVVAVVQFVLLTTDC